MKNSEPYASAVFMSAPTIAGVRVRPLSAWHVACLATLGSPYYHGTRAATAGDAAIAVEAFRTQFGDGLASVLCVVGSRWRRRSWAFRMARHKDAMPQIEAHIAAYSDHPECVPGDGGKPSMVPWWFLVPTRLIKLGFSEAEAWNMPLVRARCYLAAEDEGNGASLLDRDEIEKGVALLEKLEAANGSH